MEIKIQAISKEVLRFYKNSTVRTSLSERSEELLTKVVKWRSLAHEPIELKNGELGKLKTKS